MAAHKETLYVEQGATFAYGFTLYHPLLDTEGNLVWEVDPDTNEPVLDSEGNKIPVPDIDDPVNLTGCFARMQIRQRVTAEEVMVNATSEEFDLETAPNGGRIILGGATGRIDIVLTDLDTDAVTFDTGSPGAYDFELVFPLVPGELRPRVERLLEGSVVNDRNVTRDEVTA